MIREPRRAAAAQPVIAGADGDTESREKRSRIMDSGVSDRVGRWLGERFLGAASVL